MKRFLLIAAGVYIFFLAEFFLFSILGRWGKIDLLLLLIVFLNLYLGVRYGLVCAFLSGLLRDAFSTEVFGTYIFLFMLSAFMAIVLRRNFYQPGSRLSRLIVTFGVVVIFIVSEAIFKSMAGDINWPAAVRYVFAPELLTTMCAATFVFGKLKSVAQKVNL